MGKPKTFNNGRQYPLIWAYIGTDDPSRGDSQGSTGLSERIAELMNGQAVYVDKKTLGNEFPGLQLSRNKSLASFIKKNGKPKLVLGTQSMDVRLYARDNHRDAIVWSVERVNESLSKHYSKTAAKFNLVAHNLTKSKLKREAKKLDEKFSLKGPVVGIFLGSFIHRELCDAIARKIISIAKNYDEITLFVCPNRRAEGGYDHLMNAMKKSLNRHGLLERFRSLACGLREPQIRILGVPFDQCRKYNPYQGLLGRSDHIIQVGDSGYVISECLFTGKTVFTHQTWHCNDLEFEKPGTLKKLMDCSDDEPFPTEKVPPLDVTGEVAASIIKEFEIWRSKQQAAQVCVAD